MPRQYDRLTFTSAKQELKNKGVVLTKSTKTKSPKIVDEYRVRKADSKEIYYTDDLVDAYNTGLLMAKGLGPDNSIAKPISGANVQAQIQSCADERVKEFHNRLKANVAKLTCDIVKNDQQFLDYVSTLSAYDVANLAVILRKEVLQIVDAVNSAE